MAHPPLKTNNLVFGILKIFKKTIIWCLVHIHYLVQLWQSDYSVSFLSEKKSRERELDKKLYLPLCTDLKTTNKKKPHTSCYHQVRRVMKSFHFLQS